MRRILTFLFAALMSVGMWAAPIVVEGVQIGDLYYNLNNGNKTAEVTSMPSGKYTGGIIIPESVEYYSVTFTVTSIGESAFNDCHYLTSITIPNSVTSIGGSAFYNCNGLTSIEIPNCVTSIGDYAFAQCELTSVTIGNSVTSIGAGAFGMNGHLTSIEIPNSVESIGDYAFAYCTGLTSVTIGNSVTSIGEAAFAYCIGLTSVTIPEGVTSIGDGAFGLVPNIVYSGSATGSPWGARSVNGYVDGFFVYSDNTKTNLLACSSQATGTIEIPNSVTSIGDYAFYYCPGITSITIPNSVISIGEQAFAMCSSLASIEIPNSVTSIGESAFTECSNLETVILNSNPTIGEDAFPDGATVTMNLTANAAGGAYWMTFYNQNYGFEADVNTQVFKAALTGTELELTELTTDQTVTKNNAVILKSTASPIVMTLTSTASSNDFSGNSLQGVSAAAGLTAADPSTTFVLNNGTGGVGFYRLKSGKTVGVGKAYLTYDGAFAREFFGFEETTGIEMPAVEGNADADAVVYDLQGRRVQNPTKGLYIVNGKKVFINK